MSADDARPPNAMLPPIVGLPDFVNDQRPKARLPRAELKLYEDALPVCRAELDARFAAGDVDGAIEQQETLYLLEALLAASEPEDGEEDLS